MRSSRKRSASNKASYIIAFIAAVALGGIVATTQARASHSTKSFVQAAAIGNQFEISASRLALQNSQNDSLKQFAQQMLDDHTQVGAQLKATLAVSDANIPEPEPALDTKHQRLLDQLQKASPQDFDKLYTKDQVAAHDDAVKLFKDYAKYGDNQALKDFADETLPTLEEHKNEAHELQSSI